MGSMVYLKTYDFCFKSSATKIQDFFSNHTYTEVLDTVMDLDLDTDEHKPLFEMMTTDEDDQAKDDVAAQVMLLVRKLKRNKTVKVSFNLIVSDMINTKPYPKFQVYEYETIEEVLAKVQLLRLVRKSVEEVFTNSF